MSIATVITDGYGSFTELAFVIPDGYGDFGVTPTPSPDTHDGVYEEEFDLRKLRKNEEEFRKARERLREQIRLAMDGPEPQPVQEAITPYLEPNVPIESVSLDWDAFLQDMEAIRKVRAAYDVEMRRLRIIADDEDILRLL